MELKEFIKNTISSISESILESQEELKERGILVNPEEYEETPDGIKRFSVQNRRHLQTLEFDVLVGVEVESGGKGEGRIKVAELLTIGAEKSKKKMNENQSRIKFEIPIAFSTVNTPSKYNTKAVP